MKTDCKLYARWAVAAAVLAVMVWMAVLLLPPYLRNLEFQRALERISAASEEAGQNADLVRVAVLAEAGRLGVPVRSSNVQVAPSAGRFRVQVTYVVSVDLHLYVVDLHFRPRAGR